MNPIIISLVMGKSFGRLGSLEEKENSKLNPVKLRLK